MSRSTKTIVAIACLLLAGCDQRESSGKELSPLSTTGIGINRIYDAEYGIVCYRYISYGIACVKVTP